ncbi:hypothetical protein [Terracoccus luteus]|uniref:Uncharacterized protein n=1 Tax=Terracoccus luteus TaxID=53356 RepID=A0A839PPK5_9MICO|nr:hypothetical protein [Terracoccus luteus]MBB2986228.1 hypothetical protein [Terracoccus luteus]MCP2172182.1 hypothetical protein [Terracoccus luteus]
MSLKVAHRELVAEARAVGELDLDTFTASHRPGDGLTGIHVYLVTDRSLWRSGSRRPWFTSPLPVRRWPLGDCSLVADPDGVVLTTPDGTVGLDITAASELDRVTALFADPVAGDPSPRVSLVPPRLDAVREPSRASRPWVVDHELRLTVRGERFVVRPRLAEPGTYDYEWPDARGGPHRFVAGFTGPVESSVADHVDSIVGFLDDMAPDVGHRPRTTD